MPPCMHARRYSPRSEAGHFPPSSLCCTEEPMFPSHALLDDVIQPSGTHLERPHTCLDVFDLSTFPEMHPPPRLHGHKTSTPYTGYRYATFCLSFCRRLHNPSFCDFESPDLPVTNPPSTRLRLPPDRLSAPQFFFSAHIRLVFLPHFFFLRPFPPPHAKILFRASRRPTPRPVGFPPPPLRLRPFIHLF